MLQKVTIIIVCNQKNKGVIIQMSCQAVRLVSHAYGQTLEGCIEGMALTHEGVWTCKTMYA